MSNQMEKSYLLKLPNKNAGGYQRRSRKELWMKWRDSGFSGRSTESTALCAWVHRMQYPCAGQGRQPCPVNWRCTDSYWVITWRKMPQVSGFAAPPPAEKLEETEEQSLKLAKHNGRAGKNDAYTPKLKKRPARRRACSMLIGNDSCPTTAISPVIADTSIISVPYFSLSHKS